MITEQQQISINNQKAYIYKNLTYKIIGCCYEVHRQLGSIHKEIIYHKALAAEFKNHNISFTSEKSIDVYYKGKKIGLYKPDFIIDEKIILEIKVAPMIVKSMQDQIYYYVKGSKYSLALLINFGTQRVGIKRFIYTSPRL